MTRKRTGLPRGLRGGSDARKLIDAIIEAGVAREDIELNGGGHLKVHCPDGKIVVVGSILKSPGAYASARRDLAAHGVLIPARGGSGNRGNRGNRRRVQHRPGGRQGGTVTRYRPGESYALATGDDGSTWFISVQALKEAAAELAEGCVVTFSGSPSPEPGKRYPDAREVRIEAAGQPRYWQGPPAYELEFTPFGRDAGQCIPPERPLSEPESALPPEYLDALRGIREQMGAGGE